MKLLSWNVNGIRSVNTKTEDGNKITGKENNVLDHLILTQQPDYIFLQEIKCGVDHLTEFSRYEETHPCIYTNCAKNKKGYSGVAVLCKKKPLKVYRDFEYMSDKNSTTPPKDFELEGRVLTVETASYFLVCTYTPNSKPKLERLRKRVDEWGPMFKRYIQFLPTKNPVIIGGDLNVPHKDIDIHTPKGHNKSAGFTKEEREDFGVLLESCKLVDTFRLKHPQEKKYTYFSNFAKAREKNNGWRIDYFLVSEGKDGKIKTADILVDVKGSDHVPIILELE